MSHSELEDAKAFFQDDRFATRTTGCEIIAVGDRYAKCALKIEDKHKNAAGNVMGGAIFTLADFTFAVASNYKQQLNVSTSSQITFLGRAKGTQLLAESRLIKDGRTTCFYEITIHDELGTLIALATISGMKLN